MATVQLQTYTAEEFLELDLPENQEYELIGGTIVPMAEPSGKHENLRSDLLVALRLESKKANLGLLIHPQPVLVLGRKDTRKPDLIAIDRESWNRQTQTEAILREPPSIVIEIKSSNPPSLSVRSFLHKAFLQRMNTALRVLQAAIASNLNSFPI